MAALTLAFLNAYDNAPVITQLSRQLAPPSGMAWIWWGMRTSFANPAEDKTANGETSRPDLSPRALPRCRCCACAPETAGLNHLPGNERRNAKADFARSPDQGKGEGAVARNAKQTPDHKIAAFLHSQPCWNRECRRANC